MPVTVSRSFSNLIGTPASPATLAALASVSGAADIDGTSGCVSSNLGVTLIPGVSPPVTQCTIQFSFSDDGTNYILDGPLVNVSLVASTPVGYRYDPPDSAKKAQVTVTCGSVNGITLWAQGGFLAIA